MTAPISNIPAISFGGGLSQPAASGASGEFGKLLQGSINTLESLHQDSNNAIQKFLTGENDDIHTTVLATQKAEMAFDLGLQVRNKVVSAYQEIMKMQM